MIFYCPGNSKHDVIDKLKEIGIDHQRFNFQNKGLETWTSRQ